ncbi:MAG: hypothetical protein ABIJ14_00290 [Nanoarchaeota archaeon]|nr:hypothetical protein [Nanoarchaeota archaeon]
MDLRKHILPYVVGGFFALTSLGLVAGCDLERMVRSPNSTYTGEKKSGVSPANFGKGLDYNFEDAGTKTLMEEAVEFYRRRNELSEVPIRKEHSLYIDADRIFQKDKEELGDGYISKKEAEAFRNNQKRDYENSIMKAKE